LKKEGHKVPLLQVSYGGGGEFHSELTSLFSNFHVDIELYPLPLSLKSRRLSMFMDTFRSFPGVDLIHGTSNFVPFIMGAKRVLTLHDVLQAYSPSPARAFYVVMRRIYYRCMLWLQAKSVHSIITDHDMGRLQLEECLGVAKKVRVVYPPLDKAYLEAPLPKENNRPKTLLAFATNDPRKNIDNLLFAFAALPLKGEWKLKIVSNSDEMTTHLRELTVSLLIDQSVSFMKNVPQWEMPLLYESVWALLFPSLGEGFGYPVYEALSQGVPVLCAKGCIIGPLRKYVDPMLIECESLTGKGLVEGLQRIGKLELNLSARTLAAEAVRTALNEDLMAVELLKVYRKAAPSLFESRRIEGVANGKGTS